MNMVLTDVQKLMPSILDNNLPDKTSEPIPLLIPRK